jgi:hypothetical protein
MDHIIVKIVQLGTEVQSFAMQRDATVGDLFTQAERDFVAGEVTRRNEQVTEDTRLCDGDTIYIAKMVKGNLEPFEIEIFRLGGGRSITLPAQDGQSIKVVLDQLGPEDKAQFFRQNGTPAYEFRISGVTEPVSIDHVIQRPTSGKVRVICSQVVKGNVSLRIAA